MNSILAVTDCSLPGGAALLRAGELARRRGAELRLLHFPEQPGAVHRLAHAAQQLRELVEVPIRVLLPAERLEDVARAARGSELVVTPWRPQRSLAALLLGSAVQRLARAVACPVLVVKNVPLGPYHRALVAVDLGRHAVRLVRAAADLVADAPVEVFHAIGTHVQGKMWVAQASEEALRHYRATALRHAHARLAELVGAAGLPAARVSVAVDFGDPANRAVQQQHTSRADLVAVGRGELSSCGELLLGSVAQRVASWGGSDVLIVPHGYLPATRRTARARLREELRRLPQAEGA